MLGPESPGRGARSAKTIGASPVTLYLMVEDVDKVVAKAIKVGATAAAPVAEMFWGDRCGTIVDPDGNPWMVATHASEPTPQEMRKKMLDQTRAQADQRNERVPSAMRELFKLRYYRCRASKITSSFDFVSSASPRVSTSMRCPQRNRCKRISCPLAKRTASRWMKASALF